MRLSAFAQIPLQGRDAMGGHEHLRGIAGVDRDAIARRQAEKKARPNGLEQVGRRVLTPALQRSIHRDERLTVYVEQDGLETAPVLLNRVRAGNVEGCVSHLPQQLVTG